MGTKRRESFNPLLKSYPDSEKINAVSIGAETLYTRLLARSDDRAHYYADPPMVLGKLFTHRMCHGQVSVDDVAGWLDECERAGLIRFYTAEGRRYLEVVDCKKSLRLDVLADVQFPLAPEDADSSRVRPERVTDAGRGRNGNGTPTQPNPTQPNSATNADGPVSDRSDTAPGFTRFWDEWPTHRRKVAEEKCLALWRRQKLEAKAGEILDALRRCKASRDWQKNDGEYIVAPLRWLNESRWKAAAEVPAPVGPSGSVTQRKAHAET